MANQKNKTMSSIDTNKFESKEQFIAWLATQTFYMQCKYEEYTSSKASTIIKNAENFAALLNHYGYLNSILINKDDNTSIDVSITDVKPTITIHNDSPVGGFIS